LGVTIINKNIPTQITSLFNITQVSAGHYHSMVLDCNGNVFSFGLNTVILSFKELKRKVNLGLAV
jgi:alpha-tubulin suppressor-like RCC1 family protein